MSDLYDIDSKSLRELAITEAQERIRRATAISFMKNTEGWGILLDTFEDMKGRQLEELSRHTPGDEKAILAAHSVWYAVVHTLNEVTTAVDFAIRDGEAAKLELAHLQQVPDEDDEY